MLPAAYLALPPKELAFVVAAVELKIEAEKKKEREMARNKARRKR